MKKIKTIKEFIKSYYDKNLENLKNNYPGLPLNRLVDEYCDFDNSSPEDCFITENLAFFEKINNGVPLEYINFKSFFYTSEFYVNPNVLIPRSETEILVEDAINYIKNNYHQDFSIYDVGVGSGVIALSIAKEVKEKIQVYASDISAEAVEVAKINYEHLRDEIYKESTLDFKIQDRLSDESKEVDLIVSNPPYIKFESNQKDVHQNVLKYEPQVALFLPDEQYSKWFNTFFSQVNNCLKSQGYFMMEGHENNLEELKTIAEKYFQNIQIKQDYTGRNRFLYASKL